MSLLRLCSLALALPLAAAAVPAGARTAPELGEFAVSAPVLKWQRGGCFTSWCQTGWYSSPAVADLDGDGQAEVIWGSYDVVALNGADGALKWRAPGGGSRVWPGVVVADLTGDGSPEVVVGRSGDKVTVLNSAGGEVWTRNPFGGSGELRTLAVQDLESDGQLEIVVGRASSGGTNQLSVYGPNGAVRPGWPARRTGEPGYGAGMYNENVAVGDLNGDGYKEVIGPTDTHYITSLDRNGNQLPANAIYGPGKVWSQVGVHVDHGVDLRGYANCGTEHRPNFANSAPAIADVNGDGVSEIVVVGDVYNCAIGDNEEGDMYAVPWILNMDRTRWSGSGYDWTVLPAPEPNSGPLSEDYNVIENCVFNAAVADLDGDGLKEIVYPSFDGRMHAYWLDKTQHGNWPYDVPGTGMRFAGEPAIVDLDNDGRAEVIFTSWPQKGGTPVGQLHILDYLGNQLFVVDLPGAFPADSWNGGLGAPTVANMDADPDKEVVVGTAHSGVVAYDLPNTADARVLWGTGRGNQRRNGTDALGSDTPCAYMGTGGTWFARNLQAPGAANLAFRFGPASAAWVPLAGDYTGNGTSTPGLYDPATGTFFLRRANAMGPADLTFGYGPRGAGWVPIIGDWDGNGTETVGLYNPASGTFFLKNSNAPGSANVVFSYGPAGAGWKPIAGDWDGNGVDTVGLYAPSTRTFFLKDTNTPGAADAVFGYGPANATPLAGDWDGDGRDSIGVYLPATAAWFLRNENGPGPADHAFVYGPVGATPIAGNWDGL
jgi:hypothetical protein